MNRLYIVILSFIFSVAAFQLQAQQVNVMQNTNMVNVQAASDTLAVALDSTLIGKSVIDLITSDNSNIAINRTAAMDEAFVKYLKNNKEKKIQGYRIRIYFDNKQTARQQSEEVEKMFLENFPQYPVYRTYTNPYFKVAVGDCRTKSDATRLLREIQSAFPNAFIIRDVINYPL